MRSACLLELHPRRSLFFLSSWFLGLEGNLWLLCVQDVTWEGPVAGVDAALERFKADRAYPISQLRNVSYVVVI